MAIHGHGTITAAVFLVTRILNRYGFTQIDELFRRIKLDSRDSPNAPAVKRAVCCACANRHRLRLPFFWPERTTARTATPATAPVMMSAVLSRDSSAMA